VKILLKPVVIIVIAVLCSVIGFAIIALLFLWHVGNSLQQAFKNEIIEVPFVGTILELVPAIPIQI